jgi:hypothetical protein
MSRRAHLRAARRCGSYAALLTTIATGSLEAQVRRFVVDQAWMPARVEQRPGTDTSLAGPDVLHLRNGRRIVTRLYEVQALGQLPRPGRPPYLLVGAHECTSCDAEKRVYAIPSDSDSIPSLPPGYSYPGVLSFPANEDGPSYRGRLFIGRCLADSTPLAAWFQSDRDSTGRWVPGVYQLSVVGDSLVGRFLEPRPALRATVGRVRGGTCFEVPGIENFGG